MMKTCLFLLTLSFSIHAKNELHEEIVENTVNLSNEIIELDNEVARNIASSQEENPQLNSDQVNFWLINED